MFSQTFGIQNYLPLLTAEQAGKQQDQLAVTDGANFAWKARGPFSAYGNAPVSEFTAAPLQRHPYLKRIANTVYAFTATGVRRLEANGSWAVVFAYSLETYDIRVQVEAYKWSYAYVGTRHWFCHPQVGLIWYDEFENQWGQFWDDCWARPAFGITQAENRLVILLRDVVLWSAFDRGDQFPHQWETGSGAQSLALIRYGRPLGVFAYNDGWVTFTTMGAMVSRPAMDAVTHPDGEGQIYGALTFNHQEITFENLPIGPAAICSIDDQQVIWLARTGFYAFQPSAGGGFGALAQWQPEMGLFYADSVVPNWPLVEPDFFGDVAAISWVPEMSAVAVSSKSIPDLAAYDRAHVFQTDIERWGSFDEHHTVFGPPANAEHQFTFLRSILQLRGVDHRNRAGSWVRVSPMRLQLPQEPSLNEGAITSVQSIRLGTSKRFDALHTPVQQFQSTWGGSKRAAERETNCAVYISGGWDAETQNVDQGVTATLVHFNERTRHYACDTTGMTHTITIATEFPEQYFEVNSIELGFYLAGQI